MDDTATKRHGDLLIASTAPIHPSLIEVEMATDGCARCVGVEEWQYRTAVPDAADNSQLKIHHVAHIALSASVWLGDPWRSRKIESDAVICSSIELTNELRSVQIEAKTHANKINYSCCDRAKHCLEAFYKMHLLTREIDSRAGSFPIWSLLATHSTRFMRIKHKHRCLLSDCRGNAISRTELLTR